MWLGLARNLKNVLHSPPQLRLMAGLRAAGVAGFGDLGGFTGLSASSLSQHLSRLVQYGYVEISKHSRGRRAVTRIAITESGQYTIDEHWRHLELIRAEAQRWKQYPE